MSEAMKLIVDGYLSLKNRSALQDLQAHRQRLRNQLRDQPNPAQLAVVDRTIEELGKELDVIEAGLASF